MCTGEQGHGGGLGQADGNVEESLRNGSEPSHTSLAEKPAAARETGPRLRNVRLPWGGGVSHFLSARGSAPLERKWKPGKVKALASQNTACL